MKRKRRSLIVDLVLLSILPLLIFGILVTMIGVCSFSGALETQVEVGLGSLARSLRDTYALAYPGDFALVDGRLQKGETDLFENNTVLDSIKNQSGIDATIFYGDVRQLTTIRTANGERAYGTTANQKVVERVLQNGQEFFFNRISVNGTLYYGYYLPLENADGSVVGMVFVGKPTQEVVAAVTKTIAGFSLAAVSVLSVTALICVLYAKRLLYILQRTMDFLGKIAQGNVRETIDPALLERQDELGEIGKFAVILQKSLVELIGLDPLTGLYNRRSCQVTLENLLRDSRRMGGVFSLAMGDIDDFKRINDTYGHQCGDKVLKDLAKLFMEHMENRGFVFRWGGEEFLFVYEGAGAQQAKENLEILSQSIQELPIAYQQEHIYVTMTFGVAQYQREQELSDLITIADEHLYWGKAHNKNQVVAWLPKDEARST